MQASELTVGMKVRHTNGIGVYAGSKERKFSDSAPEMYATIRFAIPTSVVHLPHRSLHLIEPVSPETSITDLAMPRQEMSDVELIELFLK